MEYNENEHHHHTPGTHFDRIEWTNGGVVHGDKPDHTHPYHHHHRDGNPADILFHSHEDDDPWHDHVLYDDWVSGYDAHGTWYEEMRHEHEPGSITKP